MYQKEWNMFNRIRDEIGLEYVENMDDEWQMNVLIGVGWRKQGIEIKRIVLEYIMKANEIRKRYIKWD